MQSSCLSDLLRRAENGMSSVRLACVIVIVAIVTGCANLQAVNTTADQLVSAASSWNSVADEFEASCFRRNQVSDVPSACTTEKQTTEGLKAADKILTAYFTAVQRASTSSNFSVTSGISALSSSVESIPGINAAQTQAISGLASYLANVATESIEQRTINSLISNGAPKAEAAIDVMNDFVVPQLKNVFARERSQTLATFVSYIEQSGATVDLRTVDCASGLTTRSFKEGLSYLLAQAYCARVTELSAKSAALTSYQASLSTAKAALEKLDAGKDDLGAKLLAQQLISQASSLKNDISKINNAF